MNNESVSIGGRTIGLGFAPYIIAEMSANHNGSLEAALAIIKAAKNAGADAVKLQTYTPDTITLRDSGPDFRIEGGIWAGRTLYDLYQEAHTPWDWHRDLFEYAREIGITIFSSPFDKTAVDFLEELDAPAYKVASFEAIDTPLIRYIAQTGKPMIISTGMADFEEIGEAVLAARDGGCKELALLHCVSGYPAPAGDYNLRTLQDMHDRFRVVTGLSDHTLGSATAVASVALGASLIEKHFTLDRSGGGPDDAFSLEPAELEALCCDARTAWEALGVVDYGKKSSELGNIQFRRSLYFVKDLSRGEEITEDCVRSVRPGYGMAPGNLPAIIGRRVVRDVKAHTPVREEVIED